MSPLQTQQQEAGIRLAQLSKQVVLAGARINTPKLTIINGYIALIERELNL